jgi:hypothetical protein
MNGQKGKKLEQKGKKHVDRCEKKTTTMDELFFSNRKISPGGLKGKRNQRWEM